MSVLFIVFPTPSTGPDASRILFKYLLNSLIFQVAAALHAFDPSKLDLEVPSPGALALPKEKQTHKERERDAQG